MIFVDNIVLYDKVREGITFTIEKWEKLWDLKDLKLVS